MGRNENRRVAGPCMQPLAVDGVPQQSATIVSIRDYGLPGGRLAFLHLVAHPTAGYPHLGHARTADHAPPTIGPRSPLPAPLQHKPQLALCAWACSNGKVRGGSSSAMEAANQTDTRGRCAIGSRAGRGGQEKPRRLTSWRRRIGCSTLGITGPSPVASREASQRLASTAEVFADFPFAGLIHSIGRLTHATRASRGQTPEPCTAAVRAVRRIRAAPSFAALRGRCLHHAVRRSRSRRADLAGRAQARASGAGPRGRGYRSAAVVRPLRTAAVTEPS